MPFLQIPESPRQHLPELTPYTVGMSDHYRNFYNRLGFLPPWTGYFFLENGRVAGACGFKGNPSENQVEIAYFTFPGFENRGIATEMASFLIATAREAIPGLVIRARTVSTEGPSPSLLKKLGFQRNGLVTTDEDGDCWEWLLF